MCSREDRYHTDLTGCIIRTILLLVFIVCCDDAVTTAIAATGNSTVESGETLFDTCSAVVDVSMSALDTAYPSAPSCLWLVLYYDSTCGHCRGFAPVYASFAVDFRSRFVAFAMQAEAGRNKTPRKNATTAGDAMDPKAEADLRSKYGDMADAVQLVALNCAVHDDVCRADGVTGVPALHVLTFAAGQRQRYVVPMHDAADDGAAAAGIRGPGTNITDGAGALWVGEVLESLLEHLTTPIHMVNASRHAQGPPRVELLPNPFAQPHNCFVCKALRQYLCARKGEYFAVQNNASAANASLRPQPPFREVREYHRQDVAGAFLFSMWHEVPMAPRTPQSQAALHTFLAIVADALPWLQASTFVAAIEFDSITAWRARLVAAEVPAQVKGVLSASGALVPSDIEWSSCAGSSWRFRGFTCGMWLLYHTVTASSSDADGALRAIQQYVAHFFLCQECRGHFGAFVFDLPSYATLSPPVNITRHPLAQLWRAHNAVNHRLLGGGSSDPAVPKRLFPDRALCPSCFLAAVAGPTEFEDGVRDPSSVFDMTSTVAFLARRYGGGGHDEEPGEAVFVQTRAANGSDRRGDANAAGAPDEGPRDDRPTIPPDAVPQRIVLFHGGLRWSVVLHTCIVAAITVAVGFAYGRVAAPVRKAPRHMV